MINAQTVVGSAVYDSKNIKGLDNRLEHSGQQIKNIAKTNIKDTFVTAGGAAATVGAAVAVSKSARAQKAIGNFVKEFTDDFANSPAGKNIIKFAQDNISKFRNLPANTKAAIGSVAVLGTLITTAASRFVKNQGCYNAGKINQKYVDKSNLQQAAAKDLE